jgi:hypothetical protein
VCFPIHFTTSGYFGGLERNPNPFSAMGAHHHLLSRILQLIKRAYNTHEISPPQDILDSWEAEKPYWKVYDD